MMHAIKKRSEPADTGARAGVYVHFPWCLAKCPYCDFVSYVEPDIDHHGYASAVLRELDARAPAFVGRRIESVFFGGGTPSLWDSNELGRVLAGVRAALDTCGELEVTVECNPTSLDEAKARALANVGVNRLSIGVQSLDDQRLRFLGRLHDARRAITVVSDALRSGMRRVSADLIFGLAGQTARDARDEAEALVDLGLSHVSAYQLTIEAGTRFGELARRGRLPMAEDVAVADSFAAIDETMADRGLRHYEVSNYARPGEEARHNLGYWRGDEYLGLGCGAYGFVREACEPRAKGLEPLSRGAQGVRWRNAVNPERYIEAARATRSGSAVDGNGIEESREALDAQTLLRERIMLGLRVAEGIDLADAAQELGTQGWTAQRLRAAAWLEDRGRIVREGSRMRIPRGAWLWTDDTSARLF
jgi:putative oxygen-independent coproporphyrinogen III oxidase